MHPFLYRKRLIPAECILLKDDEILLCNDEYIVTKWHMLKPKKGFDHGDSCYFLKEGFKISRFFGPDNNLIYHYIDIIRPDYDKEHDSIVVTDLLADIIIYPDGSIKVVDLDEISDAIEQKLIDVETACRIMRTVDKVLKKLYKGKLNELCQLLYTYGY